MFSLTLLLFLPLCSAAIYEAVADLPAVEYDYIIVGGAYFHAFPPPRYH